MARIFLLDDESKKESQEGINYTIKPIEEDDANAEIEQGEIVLNPDMGALWKALGKKHYNGGTPVRLKDGSFIFSNDKSLAIDEEEKELFEIETSSDKLADNTPAALVNQLINPKEYNTLVAVLSDNKKDDISKQSATLMLQKYMEKLGQIAYLQEAKKGNPAPSFSAGTAPVYDENLYDELERTEQFRFGGHFQDGGRFRNPFSLFRNLNPQNFRNAQGYRDYLYKTNQDRRPAIVQDPSTMFNPTQPFQTLPYPAQNQMPQGVPFDPVNQFQTLPYPLPQRTYTTATTRAKTTQKVAEPIQVNRNETGATSGTVNAGGIEAWQGDKTTGIKNASRYSTEQWKAFAEQLGFKGNSNLEFQKFLADNPDPTISSLVRGLHTELGDPIGGMFDGKLGHRWDLVMEGILNNRKIDITKLRPELSSVPITPTTNKQTETISKSNDQLKPNDFNNPNVIPYNPNIPLNPLQSLNLLYATSNALSIPKFFPMRPQMRSPLVELERINAQPVLNQLDNATYQAYAANSTLNPILQAAQNAAVYGKSLDSKSAAIGNVLNTNVQIANQQNMTNNQIQTNDLMRNIAFNQQYQDAINTTNQNFIDERRVASAEAFGLFNDYMSQNAALKSRLMSQRLFTKPVLDENGNQVYDAQGRPVMQQSPLFDIDNTGWSPNIYYTGAGNINQVPSTPSTMSLFDSTVQKMISMGVDAKTAAIVAGKIASDKEALQYSVNNNFKKGGKYRKYKK